MPDKPRGLYDDLSMCPIKPWPREPPAQPHRRTPTRLTFSFSRALQSSCIKIWEGKPENVEKAQAQLLARAQANAEASQGKYKPGSQPSIEQSLYVKNYVRARHARARACRQIHASEPTSRSLLRAGLLNASEGLR